MTMSESSVEKAVEPAPAPLSIGQRFILARESLGLTVQEVAVYLHLPLVTIEALEQDTIQQLRGLTFARAYLRAYAKVLHLDPEPLIHEFNQTFPEPRPEKSIAFGTKLDSSFKIKPKAKKESWVKWIGYFVFLGSLILVLLWWASHNGNPIEGMAIKTKASAFQSPQAIVIKPADKTQPNASPTTAPSSNPVAEVKPIEAAPENIGATPAIGPGENIQTQMTVTDPLAASVQNTVAHVPGLQDNALPGQPAKPSTVSVSETVAQVAAVPGLSAKAGVATSTLPNNTPVTPNNPEMKTSSVWKNPDQ